jgi:MFS transporter, UMF1 family
MPKNSVPRTRAVFSWGLYDFANTIFSMNIATMYFAQWIIIDHKQQDIWYGLTYSISMLFVAISMPILGAVSDTYGRRKPFLLFFTLGCVVVTFSMGVVSQSISSVGLVVVSSLVLFGVANFFYEGGLVFYNALLPEVSTKANIGKVSGFGVALGYLGAIAGLFLVKPFVEGNFFGWVLPKSLGGGREKSFIPTAIFFLIFSLPLFFFVKENLMAKADKLRLDVKSAFARLWDGICNTRKYPGVLRFLIADYFIEDAIATVIIFMAVYAQLVMKMGDEIKIWFFIVSTTFAVIGSFLCGLVCDRIGPKKTLGIVVLGWVVSLLVAILTTNQVVFWIIGPFIGIFLGSTWTSARPLLTSLAPEDTLGQFFGLYALSGRAAAITGPVVWGGIVLLFRQDNPIVELVVSFLNKLGISLSSSTLATIQYRFAVGTLAFLMLVGLVILIKVPDKFKAGRK